MEKEMVREGGEGGGGEKGKETGWERERAKEGGVEGGGKGRRREGW